MQDCKEPDILGITTTVGTAEDAPRLARGLVEARLAACVQVEQPMRSTYRWEGRLCEEEEIRLVIKTLPERQSAVQAFLAQHHPYKVPQFLAQRMQASAAYAQWVRAEVAPSAP